MVDSPLISVGVASSSKKICDFTKLLFIFHSIEMVWKVITSSSLCPQICLMGPIKKQPLFILMETKQRAETLANCRLASPAAMGEDTRSLQDKQPPQKLISLAREAPKGCGFGVRALPWCPPHTDVLWTAVLLLTVFTMEVPRSPSQFPEERCVYPISAAGQPPWDKSSTCCGWPWALRVCSVGTCCWPVCWPGRSLQACTSAGYLLCWLARESGGDLTCEVSTCGPSGVNAAVGCRQTVGAMGCLTTTRAGGDLEGSSPPSPPQRATTTPTSLLENASPAYP